MNNTKERTALKVSITGALFMALLGFGFAVLTDSEAIFLDGVFSLVNMAMGIISLKVSRLVTAPSTKQFHYGKAQVEPMLNTGKGLLFIGVIIMAGSTALHSILTGGRSMIFGWAILYSLIAAIGCFAIGHYIKSQHRDSPTPLLEVEAKGWMIDGLISGVVLVAFVGGYFLSKTSYSMYIVYIDPGLVIVMSLMVLPVPYKILKDNVLDLLLGAPDAALQEKLHRSIKNILGSKTVAAFDLRFVKTGRFVLCDILVLIANKDTYLLSDFDTVRKRLISEIGEAHPEVDLVIELTTDSDLYQSSVAK